MKCPPQARFPEGGYLPAAPAEIGAPGAFCEVNWLEGRAYFGA